MSQAGSNPRSCRAWVALGANLGQPVLQLQRATRWIASIPGVELEAISSLRQTEPVGPPQPHYVNAVCRVRTVLAPRALLSSLATLENAAGRVRGLHWGPRTLDLDLLLYEDVVMGDGTLTLPHPGLATRRFVLEPLAELDPDLLHPVLDRSMSQLLQAHS